MFRVVSFPGRRLIPCLLLLACGSLPAAERALAAESPNVIVNYDVLNSLAILPPARAEPEDSADGPTASAFGSPKSQLFVHPDKTVPKAAAKPKATATAPLPRPKPALPEVAVSGTDALRPAAQSAESATADREPPPEVTVAPGPAPAAALSARPVPPPPPEAPTLADFTSDSEPAVATIPAVPEAPAPVAAPEAIQSARLEPPAVPQASAEGRDEGLPAAEAPDAEPASPALRILFEPASVKLSEAAMATLTDLARSLRAEGDRRLELRAHASGGGARRTSLNRARTIRSFLVDKGVASTRIDVRPLGATSTGGPPDRVDIVDARRQSD